LFSDDGTLRTLPEAEENGTGVVDDMYRTESLEERKDMVELVKRYAPVFKLSYVFKLLSIPFHVLVRSSWMKS
jgi:hypothetical protein